MSNLDIASFNRNHQVFVAANAAAATVSVAGTSETGLILYNPLGSGKVALIVDAGFSWTTAPAAVHNLGIAMAAPNVTAPSSLTSVTVNAADGTVNGGSSFVRAYSIATVPVAPTAVRWFGGANTGVGAYSIVDHIDGSLIMQPGTVVCLLALTTAAVGVGHFTWIEIPQPTA